MDAGFYPVQDHLVKGFDRDAPLLVDVGGSTGHDLAEFRRKHPEVQGQFILQDLPEVVEKAQTLISPEIKAMEHDFFKEQPVKGTYIRHHSKFFFFLHNPFVFLTVLSQAPGPTLCILSSTTGPTTSARRSSQISPRPWSQAIARF